VKRNARWVLFGAIALVVVVGGTVVAHRSSLADEEGGIALAGPTQWKVEAGKESGGPPKEVQLGQTFHLRTQQSAVLRGSPVTVTVESVDYSPMHRVNGIEVFPQSIFHVLVQCPNTRMRLDVSSTYPIRVCGMDLTLIGVEGEDDGTWMLTRPTGERDASETDP
jgi:hypothetical protein